MSLGLLLAAVALDKYNRDRTEKKQRKEVKKQEKRQRVAQQKIGEATTEGAADVYGPGRRERYDEDRAQLRGEIADLMAAKTTGIGYGGDTATADEGARRLAERKQRQVDTARLLSNYGATPGAQLRDRIRLADAGADAYGIGRDAQYDYQNFVDRYNKIRPNAALGAVSSIMQGYALGNMLGIPWNGQPPPVDSAAVAHPSQLATRFGAK